MIDLHHRLTAVAVAGLTAAALAFAGSTAVAAGRVTHYNLKGHDNRPYSIVNASGGLWFTESDGNAIGRIAPDGTLSRFRLPTPNSDPYGITVGPEGNIWFTERLSNRIGEMDLFGNLIAEYDLPTPDAQPWDIVAPSDDQVLWFTEENVDQIASIRTDTGVVTEYPLDPGTLPTGIATDTKGTVWFTEEIGNAIGRIKTTKPNPFKTLKLFPVPTDGARPWDITNGFDQNMWFTELGGHNIGRITARGKIKEFPVPGDSGIAGIIAGPDSQLWFTQNDIARVGTMTMDGDVGKSYPTRAYPVGIAAGPDSGIWFCEGLGNSIGRVELG